jgi:uncharacterized protein YgiM (DUF1202 family)
MMSTKNSLNTRYLLILAAVGLLLGLLPVAQPVAAQGGVTLTGTITNAYYLNVRSGPGMHHSVVRRVAQGDPVVLVGRNTNSTWVQLQAAGPEWINAWYVATIGNIASLPVTQSAGNALLTGTIGNAYRLNVRSGPGVQYDVVTRVTQGDPVGLIGRNANGSWVQLETGYSQAWINASYVLTAYNIYTLPVTDSTVPNPGGAQQAGLITGVTYLNVRTGPGVQYAVVRRVANSDQVGLIGRNANASWVQLQATGPEWINALYVSSSGSVWSLPVTDNSTPTTSAPVTAPTTQRSHVVQTGETLFSIALRYNVDLNTLAAANGLANWNVIYIGQTLVIP